MTYIPFDHPSLALIRCLQGYSKPLTEDAVVALVASLYMDTRVEANYLFVSEQGYKELKGVATVHVGQNEIQLRQWQGLYVTVLPTLPEGVFLIGVLDIEQRLTLTGMRLASTSAVYLQDPPWRLLK